ncbi:protoporphyrinogen/coproporphyrinogen oxidase [Hippea jasoniae]|uniref:protoporphyrinogen/coproporphyrinogen oxidase n=1 Tax=Hippea jasoniae TaxID=944479 RepID=UPI000554F071|nr:NAD(P)-binding protein [Hippea jasoniae]
MKICIIGAGITGLTAGKLLSKNHDVIIYEKDSKIGGIAKTKTVNGVTYHTVGGHCLNSKNKQIMEFIFNEVLPQDNWHKVKRIAKIFFKNHYISYPIEFSIKEIAEFDEDLAFRITRDYFIAKDKEHATNLADWFEMKFGKTLANEYFIPYNRKIWQKDPKDMSFLWVEGKLPLPNKKDFFKALIKQNEDTMPHNEFYYPNSNNQNTFIEALANNLQIITNFEVFAIEKNKNKWIINNKFEFDLVINTSPLDKLPFLIKNSPEKIKNEARKLKYNKVTNVLWKTKPVKYTWSYYPSPNTIFHRHIHIGNFFKPKQNYTITESMGEHSFEEMIEHGKRFNCLLEPIDYHVSDHAYVVYDQNYKNATKIIKDYLIEIGLYSIGRFGEWEYYNMDVCMESAMNLVRKIENKFKY